MNAVVTFVTTKLIPAITAITALLPTLLNPLETDAGAAIQSVLKIVTDLQNDLNQLIAAVKSAS